MHGKEGVVGGRRAGVGGRLARLVSEKNSFYQTVFHCRVSFSSGRMALRHTCYRSLLRAHQTIFAYPVRPSPMDGHSIAHENTMNAIAALPSLTVAPRARVTRKVAAKARAVRPDRAGRGDHRTATLLANLP